MREEIKQIVKADLGGCLAISPELYGQYLEHLSTHYGITIHIARQLAEEALKELPCHLD